jgi:Fe-S cluster assembly protein SufD
MSGSGAAAETRPFACLLDDAGGRRLGPAWLDALRASARARFEAAGLPRPGDEDWRQTNVAPLGGIAFEPAPAASLSGEALGAYPAASAIAARMTFVNGRFVPSLSTPGRLPGGVTVATLAHALAAHPGAIEPHLARVAIDPRHPFVALNTALFEDGPVVTIEAGAELAEPIHILHVTHPGAAPSAVHPRALVLAGPGSQAVVVETFVGPDAGETLTNAVTEIVLEANARVDHVKVQLEGAAAWHVASVAARVGRDARLTSHNVSFGARLARNDIGARLEGPGAQGILHGLYLADGDQHVDNHTWLDHAAPHCPSWEMYKGVLAGRARAVFSGRIVVREGAQRTDAKQSNKNLILSEGASVHTRPQLEIHANDVKCTHGATIGRLDDAALFYLRARGIGALPARDLLIHAFAAEVLGVLPVPALREILLAEMGRRLDRDLQG